MPNSEFLFITAMFVLILVGSFLSVFLFIRQYKREMQAKEAAALQKKQVRESAKTIEE